MENFDRNILDAMVDSILILDAQGRISYANTTAENQFGANLVGKSFIHIIRHPDCLEAVEQALGGQPKTERQVSLDSPVRANFRLIASHLGSQFGADSQVLVIFHDVTDIREAETIRSDFVANVSHELRSPLTAISGFVETIRHAAKDDPDAQERFLGLMEFEIERMTRLVADLLSLSKVEARSRIRPDGTANVGNVIGGVVNSLSGQADKERTRIVFETPKEPAIIPGDKAELTQVFQNLIENAIKYSAPDTDVVLTIEQKQSAAGMIGPVTKISVTDQGDGISPEHIPRLTERFYRVDTHRSRDKGGTGLGLAISKHIVTRHRGRLKVSSAKGKGSTFTVLLPSE